MLRSAHFMRGNQAMDHTSVVRDRMTEKYLLNELESDIRDEFENHYFDCPECALDVQTGAQFVEHSKLVLAENPEPIPVRTIQRPAPVKPGWFAWLRPAFAAPALALLLAVIGYQDLVVYPRLQAELREPQILPEVRVNTGTWGGGSTPTEIPDGEGFTVLLRIPPNRAYVRYKADLYNPAGKIECTLKLQAAPGQDQWPVSVPRVHRETGTYKLALSGITAAGESKDLGPTSFELLIRK